MDPRIKPDYQKKLDLILAKQKKGESLSKEEFRIFIKHVLEKHLEKQRPILEKLKD